MRGRDPAQELGIDLTLDHRFQGPGIRERFPAEELRDDRQHPEDVGRRSLRVELGQRGVVVGAGEHERRHQRAGRNAGDDLEQRTLARLRPADEEPRPERTVRAPAGQREMRVVNDPVRTGGKLGRGLLLERAGQVALHRRVGQPGRCARTGHVRDEHRRAHQLDGHRVARQRCAAGEAERRRDERRRDERRVDQCGDGPIS